jgi:hypothetical protein
MRECLVNLNSYELSRRWFDFCFENPEKISPGHTAIYFFAIEHCNRMGWKTKFGFPSQMTMDAVGISKYSTYIKYFNELINWGFLEMVQKSTNQYSANIISLQTAMPKNGKALDKALVRHGIKQSEKQLESEGESNHESDGSIIKQLNNKQDKERDTLSLENSNFFRKPKTPTKEEVQISFMGHGGTVDMAEKFFRKHEAAGWYMNNSPIVNFRSLVPGFIDMWKKFNKEPEIKSHRKPLMDQSQNNY